MADDIRRDLGKYIQLATRKGNIVSGSVHVKGVVGTLIAEFAEDVRHNHSYSAEQRLLYIDGAPGHCGEKCTMPCEKGLKLARTEKMKKHRLVRELIPENAIPELCEVDQLIKYVETRE